MPQTTNLSFILSSVDREPAHSHYCFIARERGFVSWQLFFPYTLVLQSFVVDDVLCVVLVVQGYLFAIADGRESERAVIHLPCSF